MFFQKDFVLQFLFCSAQGRVLLAAAHFMFWEGGAGGKNYLVVIENNTMGAT